MRKLIIIIFVAFNLLNATTPTKENLTKLYIATFDRAPDSAGVEYWLHSKLSLEDIAKSFFEQIETRLLYPDTLSTNEFIYSIYKNIFRREPDLSGLYYWKYELDANHLPKSVFILTVVNGALGNDAILLNNKTEVGLYFVNKNLNDISLARNIMKNITTDIISVKKAKEKIDDYIKNNHSKTDITTSNDSNISLDNNSTIVDENSSSDNNSSSTISDNNSSTNDNNSSTINSDDNNSTIVDENSSSDNNSSTAISDDNSSTNDNNSSTINSDDNNSTIVDENSSSDNNSSTAISDDNSSTNDNNLSTINSDDNSSFESSIDDNSNKMDKFTSDNRVKIGLNTAESLPFLTEDGSIEWIDIIDIMDDINLSDKNIKEYNPFSFYRVRHILKNSDFLTLWLTKNWDESWFNIDKIQKYLDSGRFLIINYWYFGDGLNYIPNDDELNDYYDNVKKLSNSIAQVDGDILLVFEPEFNKYFITSDENNSKAFANIISKAIDIIKDKNPNILISLCMMDTGIRDVNQTWSDCGYDNCALGDKHEWQKADSVYRYLKDKLDFISFEETLAQFSRNLTNPGTLDEPNATSFTVDSVGLEQLPQRILNFTKYLHNKYDKPILLDYLGVASATWSDKNGDGKIQDEEINPDGWNSYIETLYKNLRDMQSDFIDAGLFAYSPWMLIDDPAHDKNGWQFYLQNEYHFGLMKSSAKPGVDDGFYGDMVAKGVNLLENAFGLTKERYEDILNQRYNLCIDNEYSDCDSMKKKLSYYIDKSDFPIQDKGGKVKLIILSTYPDFDNNSSKWQEVLDNKDDSRVVVVVDINRGDFNSSDINYTDAIKRLSKNGIEVLGYTYTNYAKRDIKDVQDSIYNWNRFYKLAGVRGIFFDEVSTLDQDLDYYIKLSNYATSRGFLFNTLDSKNNIDESYFDSDIANVIVTFDDNYDKFLLFNDLNEPTIFSQKGILIYDVDKSKIDDLNDYIDEHKFNYYYFQENNN